MFWNPVILFLTHHSENDWWLWLVKFQMRGFRKEHGISIISMVLLLLWGELDQLLMAFCTQRRRRQIWKGKMKTSSARNVLWTTFRYKYHVNLLSRVLALPCRNIWGCWRRRRGWGGGGSPGSGWRPTRVQTNPSLNLKLVAYGVFSAV